MIHRTRVSLAVAAALASGAFGFSANAQDTVTVTGSRIQANANSSAPIIEVTAQEIKATGLTRVEEVLNALPQLVPSYGAFDVNPGTGQASVNLRGLGSQRTLVLVNGNRLQPGGLRDEAPDLNQIPVAMIKRVEVLTGGASAIYGSDAMAGVVNIILDDEFQGFSASIGASAYQHDNRNEYLRPLMDARKYKYPTGSSGLDGESQNIDLVWGGKFSDGRGYASAYFSYRQNDELLQGSRDYTSCALNVAGTACGGSGTAPNPSFLIYGTRPDGSSINGDEARIGASGKFEFGLTDRYNFAPINHFQIPSERYNFGNTVKFRVNELFNPFFETMITSSKTALQIAESGTFYSHDGMFKCAQMGTLCADLGLDPSVDQEIYVGKRNVEGGPRTSKLDSSSFRMVMGSKGKLPKSDWEYNVSYLFGKNRTDESNINDFVTTKLDDALRGCPPGSFKGCIPYDVWVKDGVTPQAAGALSATGMRSADTSLRVFNAFLTGDVGLRLPGSKEAISLALGFESRKTSYNSTVDENMATGNFTGLGGPRTETKGRTSVSEIFAESILPIYKGNGVVKSLDLDAGLRSSDYDGSGRQGTYKVGGNANFGIIRARASYNKVTRAASVGELFQDQTISLWSGSDPCAGAKPTRTLAECERTGVTASQYGKIAASPASQYNQFGGGNPDLSPETGNTVTLGFVLTPAKSTTFTADYFEFDIKDKIGTIGASTIIEQCIKTNDPALCSRIKRRNGSGDLWVGSDPSSSGYVLNQSTNLGSFLYRGLDLGAYHNTVLLDGRVSVSMVGTRMLKAEFAPFPGVNDSATYDCVGKISPNCSGTPKWKHVASVKYARGSFDVTAKWRHFQGYNYILTDGTKGSADKIVSSTYGGRLPGGNYLDLSTRVEVRKDLVLTAGINNIFDKPPSIVGDGLAATSNVPSVGYDQLGRFLFTNLSMKF